MNEFEHDLIEHDEEDEASEADAEALAPWDKTTARHAELVGGSSLYRDPETGRIPGYMIKPLPAGDPRYGKSKRVREIEREFLPAIEAAGAVGPFENFGTTRVHGHRAAHDTPWNEKGRRVLNADKQVKLDLLIRKGPGRDGLPGFHIETLRVAEPGPRGPWRQRDQVRSTLVRYLEREGFEGDVWDAVDTIQNGKATPDAVKRAFVAAVDRGKVSTDSLYLDYGISKVTIWRWRKALQKNQK